MQNKPIDRILEILFAERGKPVPPLSENEKKTCFRSLVNVRMPDPIGDEFLRLQDEYLQAELEKKGVTDIADLAEIAPDLYLWKGDITTLKCDAIVNAANSQLLGCFLPCHACIDNTIHTFVGVQLRLECAKIMEKQAFEEPTGRAKITHAYNLPCRYVIHTVGPIVYGELTEEHEKLLADCYRSCLALADERRLQSIAFCCISTGEFHFPNERGAEIAVRTTEEYKQTTGSKIKVIFNVFKDIDLEIYTKLLGGNTK